jgi:predicted ATPase
VGSSDDEGGMGSGADSACHRAWTGGSRAGRGGAGDRARTEEVLRELKAIELIYEKSLFPELAYLFKHALTHEVAYNSLLMQRRKELHRLIALAMEELYAYRLAEQFEVLTYHFAKGEEWAKAFAKREAIALYDEALEVVGQLGAGVDARTLIANHRAKADLYMVLSEYARARAEGERLLALARRVGDRQSEAVALAGMGVASAWGHDFDRALTEAYQAIAGTKRWELAQQSFQAAREVIDEVKVRLQNPSLRASFEHSPMIRHVYDLSAPS